MMAWERGEVLLLQEIVHTHAEKLGDQTDMVTMVKPCEQVDAFTKSVGRGCVSTIVGTDHPNTTHCLLRGSRSFNF